MKLGETLQRVFGLAGISPVEVVEDKNWDNVTKAVGDFVEKQYDKCDFSFKVKSKRSDKHCWIAFSPEDEKNADMLISR